MTETGTSTLGAANTSSSRTNRAVTGSRYGHGVYGTATYGIDVGPSEPTSTLGNTNTNSTLEG